MSTESFDKLLVFIGPRITYENTRLHLSLPPQERFGCNIKVRKYLFSHTAAFQLELPVLYTNTIKITFVYKDKKINEVYTCAVEPTDSREETSLLPSSGGVKDALVETG